MSISTVKRTERGWLAHYCEAYSCGFRRNTLLQYEGANIIVSTVGAYFPYGQSEMQPIGYSSGGHRFYETMAFEAAYSDPYWEADISKEISFDSPWDISAEYADALPKDVDNLADAMHEAVVAEITDKMQAGWTAK